MTSLVRSDDVQTRGETEAHASYEGVRKPDRREVEIRVRPQELAHVVLRSRKTGERIPERGCRARSDGSRCVYLEMGPHGRFERPDEPAPDNAWHRRTAAEPALLARTRGRSVHGAKIHAVHRRQVIEALRDAPRIRLGAPAGLCLTQAAYERLR